VPLTSDRAIAEVIRETLSAVRELGGPVDFEPAPQGTSYQG
jgi:hypothetical protein